MKITVQVKPNSKRDSVEPQSDGSFIVRVHAPPLEGKANERTIELLSDFLRIPKSAITLVSGHRGKRKVFQIP